jgi:uncharacterized protein with HEPN domain
MRHDRLYLNDIVEAADHIAEFLDGRDFPAFQTSELLRSAVVQKLAVIGEGAARVSEALKTRHHRIPWQQIIAFRNILVHAYFGIDWDLVWRAARNRCPVLRTQVAEILAAMSYSTHAKGNGPQVARGHRLFRRYIGVDYSGAETPAASLKGLRVYMSDGFSPPDEVQPPAGFKKYWTRRGIAGWLEARLSEAEPTLVGIDHGFSFPVQYFEKHGLPADWPAFLEDFQRHWPTDDDFTYVDFVREGHCGHGAMRSGNSRWRRVTEMRTRSAKSVFHFDVPGSVAKSTHAGLPWLLYLRRRIGERVHFWPFDGWTIPAGRSAIVEVYPSIWSARYPQGDRDSHQHDAYSTAAWMRGADDSGTLRAALNPQLSNEDRRLAQIEGWILGVD